MHTHPILKNSLSILIAWLSGHLLLTLAVNAQDSEAWKVQSLSTEHGLSNRFVQDILQDSRGYTWISTKFGLNRYDGHQFDVLTRESHQLQSNAVSDLYLDNQGSLWLIEEDAPGHNILFYYSLFHPGL